MKAKYTHKFIIYNKKRIENNYRGLVEKLAEFDKEAIPKDFLENLNDLSDLFLEKRQEFYFKNPSNMCTIDEILPYSEETNVETNKVLAFVNKYREFDSLILLELIISMVKMNILKNIILMKMQVILEAHHGIFMLN